MSPRGGKRLEVTVRAKVIKAASERDVPETEIVLVKRFSVAPRFFVFNYVARELLLRSLVARQTTGDRRQLEKGDSPGS